MRLCSVKNCGRKHRRNGYCDMHSQRVEKYGDPARGHKSANERFFDKVEKLPNGCWQWTGSKDSEGYGRFTIAAPRGKRPKEAVAHRFSYAFVRGPIQAGLTLDHLCRNRACVNPDHLEPVTHLENIARAKAARTTCKRGHPLVDANVYMWRGTRICRTCRREYVRAERI